VCASSVEPLIQGYGKGLRLQMFFDRDPQFDWVIGVLDSSPIKTLADFKGKDIGRRVQRRQRRRSRRRFDARGCGRA
jgi:hypothetical protein